MLLNIQVRTQRRALRVFAYDMACPRRARRVRALLSAIQVNAQYSVYEAFLTHAAFRGVVAELSTLCVFEKDRLATWMPSNSSRVEVLKSKCIVRCHGTGDTSMAAALRLWRGKVVVCYDVRDPRRLSAVTAAVSSRGAMLQRSVYWLRSSCKDLLDLSKQLQPVLDDADSVWLYPLGCAGDLWLVGSDKSSLLPIATHHWNSWPGRS